MVMNTVHATYSETYDLNTAINEISFLGIHTPMATALKSMFKGFFENYKKYKIVGCNIGMVCASQQSLTPDLVGLTEGQVDPRDVLNPILFKACTGENLNVILNQIYGGDTWLTNAGSSVGQSIDSSANSMNMYYQLLSDDSWRKEHPQRGLFVQGLKPLVHKVVTTQPFRWTGSSSNENADFPNISEDATTGDDVVNKFGSPSGVPGTNLNPTNPSVFISDGTTDMPWLDTTFDGTMAAGSENTVKAQRLIVSVPRVWCGCIVLPPAILQRLFFRLQIQWHIMFKDFRPAFEVGPISGTATPSQIGVAEQNTLLGANQTQNPTYWNLYHDGTTKLEKEYSSFDVNGAAEVQQVMNTCQ